MRAQDYDFNVIYEPGTGNIADGFSRLQVTSLATEVKFVEEHKKGQKWTVHCYPLRRSKRLERKTQNYKKVVIAVSEGWSKSDESLRHWKLLKDELTYAQALLWRGRRICMPALLREKALRLAHEAHQGIVRSKQHLRASLFWPGMDSDIEEFCRYCETCVRLQPIRRDTPCKPTPLPEYCWDKCAIDLVGPFPGQIYILTLVVYRSKWPEATILKSTTRQKIISVLTEVFARFGNPKLLLPDNGPQFTSEEIESFLKLNGIQHCRTSPYFPKANGQVERFHRYLEHSIRAAELDGFLWTEVLPDILQVYRPTPHAGTGMTPAKLTLNREIATKLPVVLKPRKRNCPGRKVQTLSRKTT